MKPVLFLLTATALLLGCRIDAARDPKKAVPGTYIRASRQEYGNEWDTLSITVQNEGANEYNLIRRWRYDRVLDGNALEPDYKVMSTTATYDPAGNCLEVARTGKRYTFDVRGSALFSGTTTYKKLK